MLEHHRGDDLGGGDPDLPQQLGAVDVLVEQGDGGLDLAFGRPGDPPGDAPEDASRVRGAEPDLDDRQRQLEPLDESADARVDREVTVEDDPGEGGEGAGMVGEEHPEEDVGPVARGDEDGALGEPAEDVGQGHRADEQAGGLTVEQRVVAVEQASVGGGHLVADARRGQQRVGGHGIHRVGAGRVGAGHPGEGGAGGVELLGGDAVGDDPEDLRVVVVDVGGGELSGAADLVGGQAEPGCDEEHRRAEVGRDPGVDRELGGRPDVGEVRSDDEDGLVAGSQLVVALDDRRHGAVRVVVHLLVGDPDARLGCWGSGQPGQQQVQGGADGGVAGAHERPEDTHAGQSPDGLVEQSEGDRRLAAAAAGAREVDAGGHGVRLVGRGPSPGRGVGWRPVVAGRVGSRYAALPC